MGACHCGSERQPGLPVQTANGNTLLSNRLPDAKQAHADVAAEPPVQAEAPCEAPVGAPVEALAEEAPPSELAEADATGAQEAAVCEHEALEAVPEEPAVTEAPKPDFSGEWKMVRYEGDFETWMKEAGVGWASRKVASAADYGVNGTVASIQQTAEQINIKSKSIKGTTLQELKFNDSEQDDTDVVSSKPVKVVVRWEEVDGRMTLVVEAPVAKSKSGSVSVPLTRRFLEGESMIAERTNCSGTTVRLFFSKEG